MTQASIYDDSDHRRFDSEVCSESVIPQHPMGIKPTGNQFVAGNNIKAAAGMFSYLPDELLIQLLESLEPLPLLQLGATCRALYGFARFDDLWRTQSLKCTSTVRVWRGSWFQTVLQLSSKPSIRCDNLFSDVLHRPFCCSRTPLSPFFNNIPTQNEISRLDKLNATDFATAWVNKPFILANSTNHWPLHKTWTWEVFRDRYKDVKFAAEAVNWPLDTYLQYAHNNGDESPLYLFDHRFVEKMGIKVGRRAWEGDYWIPECLGEDFFSVLDDQRPDHRWLIIGPERSGSTFHKDPNATSAWNAVIRGLKYWIMFPTAPDFPPPPGVFVSDDQSEVTSPVSLTEWLLGFHAEARRTKGCLEGLCHEGEVLHVPSGWWHLVVNVEPSIAITQNFVPRGHVADALDFLKNKPEQVSGFRNDVLDPYQTFVSKLREAHPKVLDEAVIEMENLHKKKRKWDDLVRHVEDGEDEKRIGFEGRLGLTKKPRQVEATIDAQKEGAGTSHFSFGFGLGESSDEEIP